MQEAQMRLRPLLPRVPVLPPVPPQIHGVIPRYETADEQVTNDQEQESVEPEDDVEGNSIPPKKRVRRHKYKCDTSLNRTQTNRVRGDIEANIEHGIPIPYERLLKVKIFKHFNRETLQYVCEELVRAAIEEKDRKDRHAQSLADLQNLKVELDHRNEEYEKLKEELTRNLREREQDVQQLRQHIIDAKDEDEVNLLRSKLTEAEKQLSQKEMEIKNSLSYAEEVATLKKQFEEARTRLQGQTEALTREKIRSSGLMECAQKATQEALEARRKHELETENNVLISKEAARLFRQNVALVEELNVVKEYQTYSTVAEERLAESEDRVRELKRRCGLLENAINAGPIVEQRVSATARVIFDLRRSNIIGEDWRKMQNEVADYCAEQFKTLDPHSRGVKKRIQYLFEVFRCQRNDFAHRGFSHDHASLDWYYRLALEVLLVCDVADKFSSEEHVPDCDIPSVFFSDELPPR